METLKSAGFPATQFHESWRRSAAVGVARQPTLERQWLGQSCPDGGLLILRQTLPTPDFKQSIDATRKPGEEREVLGPFCPNARYTMREAFERHGC